MIDTDLYNILCIFSFQKIEPATLIRDANTGLLHTRSNYWDDIYTGKKPSIVAIYGEELCPVEHRSTADDDETTHHFAITLYYIL